MPNANGELTPREAALIATNSYFTLKGWIDEAPVAGVESHANIQNRVFGPADAGAGSHADTSLRGTSLGGGSLESVHSAKTGFGTTSGFGYTAGFRNGGEKHVVIATRGTRPEMAGWPDLITDFRGTACNFGTFGAVHKGFKRTFDSIAPNLDRDKAVIADADVVHCVGHSLGGAVATLVAANYAAAGHNVKLYTFGSPRVGCFGAHRALETAIKPENIFRIAHDLDPITLIAPFPYIHVQPSPSDAKNFTLLSPTGKLFSTANHDMAEYIQSVGALDWKKVGLAANAVNHDDALVSRWLLHQDNNPGWVAYGSAKTLALLFKLFKYVLRSISVSLILGLTAVDLLAEIIVSGFYRLKEFAGKILTLLGHAAKWAGIKVKEGAEFTASIVRAILDKMIASLTVFSTRALMFPSTVLTPAMVDMGTLMLFYASTL